MFVLSLSLSLCARASFHWCGRGYACVGLSVCTVRVSLRGITGPTDAINYATASRAQLRRRLVLIISPFGGPLEIFANSRPAGDTMEILRCRVRARYDRSRGGERGSHVPSGWLVPERTWFCTIDTRGRLELDLRVGTLLAREAAATIPRGRFKKVLVPGSYSSRFYCNASPRDKCRVDL